MRPAGLEPATFGSGGRELIAFRPVFSKNSGFHEGFHKLGTRIEWPTTMPPENRFFAIGLVVFRIAFAVAMLLALGSWPDCQARPMRRGTMPYDLR